ncbi:ATP-binding cassette domain-containing protein [Echinicola vietnamensis]|uniref:UvrABC system protein A n=1 Tax=Echinicola vietnamensis (strain DSM 17526 / LMG 23754 / KMM 6221) TaxID=926556 RepID=L0G3X9_ECHVK|nr:ATP-binding cassette domain-containing protein [Echinicola vietnamensis]AGA80242.1 Excinuclease ATPase subunit [Echinicola vietnamensis DSM 17526]
MRITDAHQNNLKNVSLDLPENRLIVVTGLSGSGKSSLAMGVIANEGYRYFLESLPAYNQQHAQAIPTAEVEHISALPPVIKVEQSKRFQSINATFGTLSELTPLFRVLFARYAGEETMSKSLFSFNHPKGACEHCRGIGEAEYIDIHKLVGDENKTLREGAITTTLPNGYIVYSQVTVEELNKVCAAHGFSVDVPWKDLSKEQQDVILYGSDRIKVFYGKHSLESRLRWEGFKAKPREEGYYKGIIPIMSDILRLDRNVSILRFVSAKICPSCHGARIKAEHLRYRWKGLNFQEWMDLSLQQLYDRLQAQSLSGGEKVLVDKLCTQLLDLIRLGMEHYQLSTSSMDISSGDGQRIKLIKQVNSSLQGILYVFDEPSIGLPAAYQQHLRHIFDRLILRGNTVMVVEHDLNFIQSADWVVELGPKAGIEGGEVIFNGSIDSFLTADPAKSPTLTAIQNQNEPSRKPAASQQVNAFQPQPQTLSVVSRKTGKLLETITAFCDQQGLTFLTVTDQPIGKTPRSNPSTYTGLADGIRDLLAKTSTAKSLKLAKSAFSFNNKSGRCPNCEGAGVITLSMSVMGNINQVCPVCQGKRFKPDVLKVSWQGKNIAEIYDLSIREAAEFFAEEKKLANILALMLQLGLGYIKLGQPSNTLSGGEAQRIKLTKHFAKPSKKTVLLLEEPSIGLHQQNVQQLMDALNQLKKQTAGIVCFENHQLFQSQCDVWVDNALAAQPTAIPLPPAQRRDIIAIHGARTHALKDISLEFPKEHLSVVTGISGSGKSSLVIDTLHGFGLQEMTKQFSSYQQSRVGVNFQLEVDYIEGLTPSICITRKEKSFSERSDVAQQTDFDKTLRFAFSRKAQYTGLDWSASHFSNNHELGKCGICDGVGQELLPDLDKMVLDGGLSINDGLFEHHKGLAYYGQASGQYMAVLGEVGKAYGFDLNTPFNELTPVQKDVIFKGVEGKTWEATWKFRTKTREGTQQVNMKWSGLFKYLMDEYFLTRKNKYQPLKSLLSYNECSHCQGSGLQPERLAVQIGGNSIHALKSMDFKKLDHWLKNVGATESIDQQLIGNVKANLANTLKRAKQLHIDHLQLNRKSATLSGGEQQRVTLIKQLNSPLKGITYLLDEPSAGLSADNIPDLVQLLRELVEKGNTVIVIEHNKEIMLAAEKLVEIGPQAGQEGGYITFHGSPAAFLERPDSHPFLKRPAQPLTLATGNQTILLKDLARHTLVKKSLEVSVGGITAITGKSGIGKTTLVKDVLIPSIEQEHPVNCAAITWPKAYSGAQYFEPKKLQAHNRTLLVDYLDLLKDICKVFSKETGRKARDFSYKNKASQCPNCKGAGVVSTSLDVAANHIETCEVCHGQRYQANLLEYRVGGLHIAEVLALSVRELRSWLADHQVATSRETFIQQLDAIGLAHLRLDQAVKSLSSGEKQRLLLLHWLKSKTRDQLLILDEPSTGLHYADIDLLFEILSSLSRDNDILVIDHNPYLLEKIGVGVVLA